MKSNEYVQFVTERIISYMDLPTEEKAKRRMERKNKKGSLGRQLFGILPFTLQFMSKQKRNSK